MADIEPIETAVLRPITPAPAVTPVADIEPIETNEVRHSFDDTPGDSCGRYRTNLPHHKTELYLFSSPPEPSTTYLKTMAQDPYLLAYDIRCPKRLRKMHRFMLKWGAAVQYSVFTVTLNPKSVEEMMKGVEQIADETEDDIRLYRLPERGTSWSGRSAQSEGILLTGKSGFDRLS